MKVFKIFSKVFSVLAVIVTVLVLLAGSCFAIPKLIGITPYIVLSGSMEPMISTGSVVYVDTREGAVDNVQVGDVVTYQLLSAEDIGTGNGQAVKSANGQMVTHRIIGVDEDGNYIFQGDANEYPDAKAVYPFQIVGRYFYSVPEVGYFMATLNTKKLIFFGGCILGINILSMLFSALSEPDEEENKEETEKKEDGEEPEPDTDSSETENTISDGTVKETESV